MATSYNDMLAEVWKRSQAVTVTFRGPPMSQLPTAVRSTHYRLLVSWLPEQLGPCQWLNQLMKESIQAWRRRKEVLPYQDLKGTPQSLKRLMPMSLYHNKHPLSLSAPS